MICRSTSRSVKKGGKSLGLTRTYAKHTNRSSYQVVGCSSGELGISTAGTESGRQATRRQSVYVPRGATAWLGSSQYSILEGHDYFPDLRATLCGTGRSKIRGSAEASPPNAKALEVIATPNTNRNRVTFRKVLVGPPPVWRAFRGP